MITVVEVAPPSPPLASLLSLEQVDALRILADLRKSSLRARMMRIKRGQGCLWDDGPQIEEFLPPEL